MNKYLIKETREERKKRINSGYGRATETRVSKSKKSYNCQTYKNWQKEYGIN